MARDIFMQQREIGYRGWSTELSWTQESAPPQLSRLLTPSQKVIHDHITRSPSNRWFLILFCKISLLFGAKILSLYFVNWEGIDRIHGYCSDNSKAKQSCHLFHCFHSSRFDSWTAWAMVCRDSRSCGRLHRTVVLCRAWCPAHLIRVRGLQQCQVCVLLPLLLFS